MLAALMKLVRHSTVSPQKHSGLAAMLQVMLTGSR